jgi:cytochrome c oxidase subunit 1/cytochrome c oxidase subunit I+III
MHVRTATAEPTGRSDARSDSLTARLTALWETPRTWAGWLATVDHKTLGKRYIYTALAFFVLGGLEASVMRAQLARPESRLLSPDAYNQLMTMHGVTMMFLFVQPVLSGFSFYLTPLMVGARELAFPRLNTFSYYAFLFAGVFIYASFAVGHPPNAGWFNYTPLSDGAYNPGLNIDFYTLGLLFLGISTTAGAFNSIVTILRLRAPGMSLDRMPLFLWSSLTVSFAVLFSMPSLTVALGFLELDRRWHFAFFDPARGGSTLLWQHLFWVFGHPWVYVVFLPATGMLSMIIPTFSRRPMTGHTFVALATVATGLIGFGVWVHHMFATGLPAIEMSFFGAASMLISIPSAVTIMAWLATMWHGRVVLATPMLFAIGFIVQFTIGGISGVMTAAIPFDWQVHDTYFVVAHLHYVLAGGTVFGLFAGIYYWAPKMYGRMPSERLGHLSFWLMFIGFNAAFFPMHVSGLLGMPRRVYTYSASSGLAGLNLLSTVGAYVLGLGILVAAWNLYRCRTRGAVAGDNPWGAASLEWLAASPPEDYNFARIPIVESRVPLWDGRFEAGPAYDEARLTPLTSPVDASLDEPVELPESNLWSVVIAIGMLVAFAALLCRIDWLAAAGFVVTLFSLARWMWPRTLRVRGAEL